MNHRPTLAVFLTLLPLSVFAGCSDDETNGTGGNGGSGATSSSTATSSSSAGANGGAGAEGGAGAAGGSGGAGAQGGAGAAGGAGGAGGGGAGGGGDAADHLVISEVAVTPNAAEFIEIYNPGNGAVDLSDYWLADNSAYHTITSGDPWAPEGTPGSDFAAKFPDGASLAGGARIVIGTHPDYSTQYNACPTYFIAEAPVECMSADVPVLEVLATVGGDPLEPGTLLSNSREMLVLFRWDGVVDSNVEDVDYVTWGDEFEDVTRIDKTGIGTYAADTARAMQKPALAPFGMNSIERCPDGVEVGEKSAGGNGITGHDETSEDLGAAFKAGMMRTPGAANACN